MNGILNLLKMYRFSWTENKDCKWGYLQTSADIFCCIHESEHRPILWSETEQEPLQNCLFDFMAQLYLGEEDIMKLYGLEKDPLFWLIKQKWKRKSSRLTISAASVDYTKLMLPKCPQFCCLQSIYGFKRTWGMQKTGREIYVRQALPWKPRLPSPGVNYLAHLWS